ncbi:MAG: hypothetical protein V4844_18690 [Pseudomonadota bacterium]
MQIFRRMRYSLYLLIAFTMVVGLTLSIGEGVGFIRGVSMQRLVFHPLYFVPVLLIGFALAPLLSERLPISGDQPTPSPSGKAPFGYAVRTFALMALGLALALLANLVVFLIGRVA